MMNQIITGFLFFCFIFGISGADDEKRDNTAALCNRGHLSCTNYFAPCANNCDQPYLTPSNIGSALSRYVNSGNQLLSLGLLDPQVAFLVEENNISELNIGSLNLINYIQSWNSTINIRTSILVENCATVMGTWNIVIGDINNVLADYDASISMVKNACGNWVISTINSLMSPANP